MEQQISPQVEVRQNNIFNRVTPLSKILAMALFIALPFIGGFVGYRLAPEKIVEVERIVVKEAARDLENGGHLTDWRMYNNDIYGFSFEYPSSWIIDTVSPHLDALATIVRVTNAAPDPNPPGKEMQSTDFVVHSHFADCKMANELINLAGKEARTYGWGPTMTGEYKFVCFDDGIAIELQTYQESLKKTLEDMLLTFKFTE